MANRNEVTLNIIPRCNQQHSLVKYDYVSGLFFFTFPKDVSLRFGEKLHIRTGIRLMSSRRSGFKCTLLLTDNISRQVALFSEYIGRNKEISFSIMALEDKVDISKDQFLIKAAIYTQIKFGCKCSGRGGQAGTTDNRRS